VTYPEPELECVSAAATMAHCTAVDRWDVNAISRRRGGWQLLAACRGLPFDVFFPPDDPGVAADWTPDLALAICVGCPVRALCRREALANRETEGVWGGLSPEELGQLHGISAREVARAREA